MAAMSTPSIASDRPAADPRRRRHLLAGLVIILVASGGYLGWQHFAPSPSDATTPAPPPLPVPVTPPSVQQHDFPIELTGMGNVTALNAAPIRSMVTEQILSIDFKDGQFVKKGEL